MPYRDLEARRAYGREWMRRNPEKARDPERHKRRLAANPRRSAVRSAVLMRRRARLAQAEGSFRAAEWQALRERHQQRCPNCGDSGPPQADHRTPLARGGMNFIENILPACGNCNQRKHKLTEPEFRSRLAMESARATHPSIQ